MPEGSGFLQWLGAVNMVVTAALAVLVWVFTAGKWARSREVDGMAHTGSADSTRTTALMEIIARELDRYDQRRPRADVARVEALMVQVQEIREDVREKHKLWRERHEQNGVEIDAALRTTVRLEERVEALGRRVDDLARRSERTGHVLGS